MNGYIVITGNVVMGLVVHGPFRSIPEAGKWARKHYNERGFIITEIFAPHK